ncbi:MAG: N-acetyltransferase family protein [Myxococcota bacterium]
MPPPIRLATPDDLPTLRRLMAAFYAESGYSLDEAAAARALADLVGGTSLGRIWLIESGGEPAGYVAVTFGFSLEYFGRDAFVDDLYLEPGFRGKGLGTRVLAAVEPLCRDLGVRALHLEVERGNAPARRLYRRRGFRDNDRQLLTKPLV